MFDKLFHSKGQVIERCREHGFLPPPFPATLHRKSWPYTSTLASDFRVSWFCDYCYCSRDVLGWKSVYLPLRLLVLGFQAAGRPPGDGSVGPGGFFSLAACQPPDLDANCCKYQSFNIKSTVSSVYMHVCYILCCLTERCRRLLHWFFL